MSAVYVAVGTAVVGVYSADRAASAAKKGADAQRESAQVLAAQADRAAELSYSLGQEQLGLSREQLEFAKQQYAELSPLAKRAADQQFAAQEEQMAQARDYYNYQTETFRPVEKGLVADAVNFDTEAYREQLASQAAADAARAFGSTQAQTARAMGLRGVVPGSGAFGANMNQNALASASQRAGAMTGARERAEQLGYARKLDAAGLGRNLPGLSTAAYQSATGAGSAGINTAMAPGNQYTQAAGQAANMYGQGASTIMAGSGQAMNAYGQLYGGANTAAINAQNNYMGVLGGMVGMGGNIAASKFGAKTT